MKTTKYYLVTNTQLFVMALMIGVISAAIGMINTSTKEYLQLPIVATSSDGKCVNVVNFKNGEAYTCSDVDTILRNYRVKKN